MMDIVSRLKKIVGPISHDLDCETSDKMILPIYKTSNGVKNSCSEDPQVIRTLIDSIPPRFYNSNSDEVVQQEIMEYGSDRELHRSQSRMSKLAAHNKAVCRRIYQLVLEKQSQYQSELNGVLILQQENLDALNTCQAVRRNMSLAMQGLVMSRLTVLVNYRRKNRLERVNNSLSKIKTLQMSVEILMELLDKEDFCKAIELYTECQAVVDDFVFYTCIDKMRKKLKSIRVNIEEALDAALLRTCEKFDADRYEILQKSFELLGNGASSIDQLQMHYASIIQNRSLQIVRQFTDDSAINSDIIDASAYSEYCKAVPQLKFLACLQKLCGSLFEIVRCYQATIEWHQTSMDSNCITFTPTLNQSTGTMDAATSRSAEARISRSESYQLERLVTNKARLWAEVSGRVKALVDQSHLDCSKLGLPDVMRLLNIVDLFSTIGLKFCDTNSLDLQDSVRSKFQDFFNSFHLKHLERLKMFLENELWEICPVKKSFSFLDLAEFASFRHQLEGKPLKSTANAVESTAIETIFEVTGANPFSEDFDLNQYTDYNENIMSDNDDMENEDNQLLRSVSEEETPSHNQLSSGPVIANTTLEVCRLIGRYVEIMRLLKPIAMDVVNSLCQLYDYYMFSVYHIFCENLMTLNPDLELMPPRQSGARLGVVLRRIWDRLIWHENDSPSASVSSASKPDNDHRIELPQCHSLSQSGEDVLAQAVVAVDSLVYLGQSLLRDSLLASLSDSLPEAKRGLLRVFSEQNLVAGQQLRAPILETVMATEYRSQQTALPVVAAGPQASHRSAVKAHSPASIAAMIAAGAHWTSKAVAANSSEYVTELQAIVREFQARVRHVGFTVPLSRELVRQLWILRLRAIDRILLDAYSALPACSQAGRNLMLVDWQSHVKFVAAASGFPDLNEHSDVERYIKAFYCGSNEFESWLRDNADRYTRQQLVSLVQLMSRSDKRLRQKWMACLSEIGTGMTGGSQQQASPSLGTGGANNSPPSGNHATS